MGKRSTPKAPDPVQLAQQQQQANQQSTRDTLRLNSQDRFGPFSNVTFNRDESGVPTGQTVTLNPNLQSTVDQTGAAASNLASFLPQGRFTVADTLGPNRIGGPGQLSGAETTDALVGSEGVDTLSGVSPLTQASFNAQRDLLQPEFERQNRALELDISNRRLPVGSEAAQFAQEPVARAQNLALSQAAQNAFLQTPAEEQRQLQNALIERQQPFQEVGQSLNILNQVPGVSFNPQPNAAVAPTDVAGIQQQGFQNQVALQGQKNQALGALLGTAGTVAGAALGGPLGASLGSSLFGAPGRSQIGPFQTSVV